MEGHGLIDGSAVPLRFVALDSRCEVEQFDCGRPSLNTFLHRHALFAPNQGLSQTFVAIDAGNRILAYYTLGMATVTRIQAPGRIGKGMPNYPLPCVLLARLAVERTVQGQGLGDVTMEQAIRKMVALGRQPRMADGSPGLPLRAALIHAIDESAVSFYKRWGFESSPTDPLHLLILLKDLKKSLDI
jgi:GNAT superfamily N-acetyltransferase